METKPLNDVAKPQPNDVELFVDGARFDPRTLSMTGVLAVLRLGLRCAIVDYMTRTVLGHFVATTTNPWGYQWVETTTAAGSTVAL